MTDKEEQIRAKPKCKGLIPFEQKVARELRELIAGKDLPLKSVVHQLEALGVRESEKGLSAKLRAGTFTAAFYIAVKEAVAKL